MTTLWKARGWEEREEDEDKDKGRGRERGQREGGGEKRATEECTPEVLFKLWIMICVIHHGSKGR